MDVKLLAHSQLADDFRKEIEQQQRDHGFTDGEAIAFTAIRTCYSPDAPTEIIKRQAARYFGKAATDGGSGSDASRLFRHITGSGHTSTLEHVSFTFGIERISRALLAQLTRHRVGFSFSVQSQRYVRLGSGDKSGGAGFVIPATIAKNAAAAKVMDLFLRFSQRTYDNLRKLGIPAEDARAVLPNATATDLVMTANLTALLSFYGKRRPGNGAQAEIAELAQKIRAAVTEVEPWTDPYFEAAGKKVQK